MECYNVSGDLEDDDELQNINIPETEGSRDVAAPDVPTDPMSQPLNIRKVNIGTEENSKFASVGDYWDKETMEKITYMLHEFQYLFPTKFSEMKGILGDLGEMKISLKADVKPVRQRPYPLNPRYKERIKVELDRMLDAGIIESVEESEWISAMVVQEKKKGEVWICVDLRKLNDACMHDPFPTMFTMKCLKE